MVRAPHKLTLLIYFAVTTVFAAGAAANYERDRRLSEGDPAEIAKTKAQDEMMIQALKSLGYDLNPAVVSRIKDQTNLVKEIGVIKSVVAEKLGAALKKIDSTSGLTYDQFAKSFATGCRNVIDGRDDVSLYCLRQTIRWENHFEAQARQQRPTQPAGGGAAKSGPASN